MLDLHGLAALTRDQAERVRPFSAVFDTVIPEALADQDALLQSCIADPEDDRRRDFARQESAEATVTRRIPRDEEETRSLPTPSEAVMRTSTELTYSPHAQALTVQPVRDTVIDGIPLLSQDRKLDIIAAPYADRWVYESHHGTPRSQSAWADAGNGAFGYEQTVWQSTDGVQADSAAGIGARFVPPAGLRVAQIRPYFPVIYQWAIYNFRSRGDSAGYFGIRVSSWDLTNIPDWEDWIKGKSWLDRPLGTPPGWDDEYIFLPPFGPPYFTTRPNRVYLAVVWCHGMCWSVSADDFSGSTIASNCQMLWTAA